MRMCKGYYWIKNNMELARKIPSHKFLFSASPVGQGTLRMLKGDGYMKTVGKAHIDYGNKNRYWMSVWEVTGKFKKVVG